MNRALKPTEVAGNENFSVQLERNIWWLGAFEVENEDFEILKCFFTTTIVPNTIDSQTNGENLEVEEMVSYKIELHMVGDLETLKCMCNIST